MRCVDVAHIGHVELLTPDGDASLRCLTDVLGLRVAGRCADGVFLRGESEYERYGVKLTEAAAAGIGHLGRGTVPRAPSR